MPAASLILLRVALPFIVCLIGYAQFKPANPASSQRPPLEPQRPKNPGDGPTFSVKVNLVRVLVSVRDSSGALITHLDKQDFHLFDTQVPQEIALFERNTSVPLSVAVLIDTSGSTETNLRYEEDSVSHFLPALLDSGNPQDSFALFSFNYRINLEADYSRNRKRAIHALRTLHGEGGTSLYDAIYLASDTLWGREGRHVMVVVTDGGDTTSYKRYDDALAAAQRTDVVVYPIVVIPIAADAGRNTGGEHALATMAASTGGRIFYPEGFEKIDKAFEDIIEELRTQYLLGFYPQDVREERRLFHPVKVETKNASYRIAARSGYYEP